MHAIFMLYGKVETVDNLMTDMKAQKHKMIFRKGKETKIKWIESQLRLLPLGIYEYVFPREEMDLVLTTLGFHNDKDTKVSKTNLTILRKMLKAEEIPKFSTKRHYVWRTDYTGIIPIGIRKDKDFADNTPGEWFGWIHEAI